jgi:pimeloyl-ACP methyl ester carboxylesterase
MIKTLLFTALCIAVPLASFAQAPPDAVPVSINLEDLPYPHPVAYLPLTMYGQELRMAYMDVPPAGQPNGRTVVLFHGMNFFGEYWADTIEVLRKEGFRVVVPDQIGFGRSSKPIIPYTLHDMAYNTKTLLEKLGVSKVEIVGHSMGGLVGTRFAFAYPKLATHLVIVNQIGLEDARLQRPWRSTDDVYRANLARSYEDALKGLQRYFVTWKPAYEKYVRIHYGWTLSGEWPRLAMIRALLQQMVYLEPTVYERPHIKVKTLVLSGAEDGPNFRAQAKQVADAIPGAELVLLDNVGHVPQMEAPDRFFPRLVQFLKSDSTARPTSSGVR